jgi:hypothetical protein
MSKEAGVSLSAVTQACDTSLRPALVGKSINVDHPSAIRYIKDAKARKAEKKKKATTRKGIKSLDKKEAKKKALEPEESHYSKDEEIKSVMDLTLRELVAEHGTDDQFKKWVDSAKVVGEIEHKNLKIAQLKGVLIPRELVKNHIFGAIENSNLRLLTDIPPTIARRLKALFKAGGTIEEGVLLVRELIGGQLKNVKTTATRVLKKKI